MEKVCTDFKVREAVKNDMHAVWVIFNDVLENSTATFEENPYSLESWIEVFETKQNQKLPFLVAEKNGEVVGYGSFGPFRKASGYKITYEHSLHVDKRYRGQGIGNAILAELIKRAPLSGIENLVAAVDADNLPSIAIHKKFGFTETGRMPNVARKFGRDLTLVLLQLPLRQKV